MGDIRDLNFFRQRVKAAQKTLREVEGAKSLINAIERHAKSDGSKPDEEYLANVSRTMNKGIAKLNSMFK